MCCILLNKEIAITGLLCTVMKVEGEIKELNITPSMVMDYVKLLNYVDCGFIIKDFDKTNISNLLELRNDLFIKDCNKEEYKLNIDHNKVNTSSELSTYLIHELLPRLNYRRKFLEKMCIC